MKTVISDLRKFIKKQRLILIAGLVGLLILETGLLVTETSSIERDITKRTEQTLQQRGFKRAEVEITGRDVTLTGVVSTKSAEELAMRLTGYVHGVRSVSTDFEIKPVRLPHVQISRTLKNLLLIEGEVPTQKLANQIVNLVTDQVNHDKMVNLLNVDPEISEPPWIEIIQSVAAEGNQLLGMEVVIGANQLSLGGLIVKQSDYNVLVQRIGQFSGDHHLEFINKIGVSPN